MTKIVAVTACIAGLAHTMMAKGALEKAAQKRDIDIKVETQGIIGIDNRLTEEEIAEADLVIFSVDTNVEEVERFDGKIVHEVSTSQTVKDVDKVLDDALEKIN